MTEATGAPADRGGRPGSGRRRPGVPGPVALLLLSLAGCAGTGAGDGAVDERAGAPAGEPAITVDRPVPIDRPKALDPALVSSGAWLGGTRHASLRAALLKAPAGAVIELESGVHPGPVELARSVELVPRLADGLVAIESRTGVALRVRAGAQVVLRDLTIRADGPQSAGSDAAVLVQNASLRAERCRIDSRRSGGVGGLGATIDLDQVAVTCEQGQTAVMLADKSTAELRHCTVRSSAGIGAGVEAWDSRCTVTAGRIEASTASLVAGDGAHVRSDGARLQGAGAASLPGGELVLVATEVHLARRGVSVRGRVAMTGCRLVGNDVAVVVMGTEAELTLSGTIFSGNGQRLAFLEGAGPSQIEDKDAP